MTDKSEILINDIGLILELVGDHILIIVAVLQRMLNQDSGELVFCSLLEV